MSDIEKIVAKKARPRQRYSLDGEVIPSVTTILNVINKPALMKWANNLGLSGVDSTKYVDETKRIGTLAHEMIQEYLNGPEWDRDAYSQDQITLAENAVISFYEWEKTGNHQMTTDLIEASFIHTTLFYGGTIDWYGDIDGKKWLVDIKTSSGLWPEHMYQVAAYKELLEHKGLQVDGVRILRVGRTEDEGFDDHILNDLQLEKAFNVFKSALRLYYAQQAYNRAFVNKGRKKNNG